MKRFRLGVVASTLRRGGSRHSRLWASAAVAFLLTSMLYIGGPQTASAAVGQYCPSGGNPHSTGCLAFTPTPQIADEVTFNNASMSMTPGDVASGGHVNQSVWSG